MAGTLMAYEPTLTVYVDADPMPRVEVLFGAFAPGTAFVTVYRLAGGREFKVRGAVMASTVGALTRMDLEAPFGVTCVYRAEMFAADGSSLGFTGSGSAVLDVAETWVHNPISPGGGVRVRFLSNAAKNLSRPTDATVFYPEGRRVGVVISGQRTGLRGVVLDCWTDTQSDATKFGVLTGSYSTTTVPVMCFRIGSDTQVPLPRPLYVAVADPREIPFNTHLGGEVVRWGVTGDEVSPPAAGIVVPLLTRADINAYYATNAAVAADNLTRLDVNRRYDLAGEGA